MRMDQTLSDTGVPVVPDPALEERPLHIAVARDLLESDMVRDPEGEGFVIRAADDTDEDYAARCRVVAALVALAGRG
jgi:hypothetical protein